jgi:LysM repeat protein
MVYNGGQASSQENGMATHSIYRFGLFVGISLLIGLAAAPALAMTPSTVPLPPSDGYIYVVRSGDSWFSVSWHTGIPIAELQALNPAAVRSNEWLWIGDRLFIPAQPSSPPSQESGSPGLGYWYQVQKDDTWYSVARDTGVPVLDLWHANPIQFQSSKRWLYAGHWLWIPGQRPPAAIPVSPAGLIATPQPAVTAQSFRGVGPAAAATTATAGEQTTATPAAPTAAPPAGASPTSSVQPMPSTPTQPDITPIEPALSTAAVPTAAEPAATSGEATRFAEPTATPGPPSPTTAAQAVGTTEPSAAALTTTAELTAAPAAAAVPPSAAGGAGLPLGGRIALAGVGVAAAAGTAIAILRARK